MPTNHLIAALFAGAVVVTWLAIIILNTLKNTRDKAEDNKRIYESEYERPKK